MKIINKSLFFLVCFLFFSTAILAQKAKIDSLKNELSTYLEKDTVRVKILNHLAFYHYRHDPKSSMEYAEHAEKLSKEIEYPKGVARSWYMKGVAQMGQSDLKASIESLEKSSKMYAAIDVKSGIASCNNALGVVYNTMGEYERALKCYEKAIEMDKALHLKKNISNYIYNMGNIYSATGKYNKALDHFKEALNEYTKSENQLGILQCWNSMAIVYGEQGNYPLALKYHNNSLDIAEKSNDSISIFQSFNNIGDIYKEQEKYDKALELYEKALAIQQKNIDPKSIAAIQSNIATLHSYKKDFDTSISYLKSTMELSKKTGLTKQVAICSNNLGVIYLAKGKYATAMRYFKNALDISVENGDRFDQALSYLGLARVYHRQNKNKLALVNATKSAHIAEELQLIKYQRDAYEFMSKIHSHMGDYKKAFFNHKLYKTLNDSLFNEENIKKITQLEYEYKYKKALDSASIRELKLTKTVTTTSRNLEKSQRNLLLGVIAFLLVTLVLAAIIFFLKLKNEKSKTKNIAIEQKLLRSQMTPHFIFNSLSVLQGMILNKDEKKAVNYLSKFSKLLRITLENSRDKIVSLSQELTAIENYLALQNLENESYKYTVVVDDTIDMTLFKVPPMLIQPFVENAIEHAFQNQKGDRTIDVHLSYLDKKLICTIIDNGIGVDSKKEKKRQGKNSLSTTITSERLKILSKDFKIKGSMTIVDRQKDNEQGTIVTLVIPYKIM